MSTWSKCPLQYKKKPNLGKLITEKILSSQRVVCGEVHVRSSFTKCHILWTYDFCDKGSWFVVKLSEIHDKTLVQKKWHCLMTRHGDLLWNSMNFITNQASVKYMSTTTVLPARNVFQHNIFLSEISVQRKHWKHTSSYWITTSKIMSLCCFWRFRDSMEKYGFKVYQC